MENMTQLQPHQEPLPAPKANGCFLELDSLMQEYRNLFDRSNKLDNKVYITITFCGFLFVFIIGLFSGLSGLKRPETGGAWLLTGLYMISCVGVMILYAYLLIYFMRLLLPEHITRMDPDRMEKEYLEARSREMACMRLIELYRATINEDLDKLHARCDEFTKGIRFIVPTVLLAFISYILQVLLQMLT